MGESKPETATQRIRADANITAAWGSMRFRPSWTMGVDGAIVWNWKHKASTDKNYGFFFHVSFFVKSGLN